MPDMKNKNKTPVDYRNFHQGTSALFTPCETPDREPDFVSPSGSAYWHEEDRVVRSSDHWAGHHGCTGQRSCVWSFDGYIPQGEYVTGECLWSAFQIRGLVPILYEISERDRRDAELLKEHEGAISWAEWISRRGDASVPRWAQKVFPGPEFIPEAAKRFFSTKPLVRHAVTAEQRILDQILRGEPNVIVGYALS